MKNRLCTFCGEFIKEEFVQSGFFTSSKYSVCLFFDTKGNCVFNSIFCDLENFDIQKIIERLDVNLNFKKQNEDYRLDFDMKFLFLHFAVYFSIYNNLKI